jgi:hypothetical protein
MAKLTPKLAAEHADVSQQLIYLWCEERRLPHYRLGGAGKRGKILIDPADLDAFMASLKVEAATTPETPAPRKRFRHLT